jgi:predicted site-specific integrase-resolvase
VSTTVAPASRRPKARPKTERVVGLTRFSQLGQRDKENLVTLDIQHDRIENACEVDGLELVTILDEAQVSGMWPLERRKGLTEALRMIEDGEADVLMVAYFDRAFRSMKVKGEVIDRVDAAGGRLKALDTGDITHATTGQWLTSSIHGLFAEWYGKQARDKSGAAQEETIMKNGIPISNTVPPGYRKRGDKTYELDGTDAKGRLTGNAAAMYEAFQMRADGATHLAIHDYLESEGIHYTVSGVRALLMNRVYRGEARFGEHVNRKAHRPLIDEETFRRAQRSRGPAGRRTKHPMLLAKLGVLVCGTCGSRMSASVSRPRPGREYHYYRCGAEHGKCPNRCSVSEFAVERETKDALRKWANEQGAEGLASFDAEVEEAKALVDKAQAELDNAVRGYTAAGLLTEPSAVDELTRLREARDTAEHEHDKLLRIAARSRRVTIDNVKTFEDWRNAIAAVFERIVCEPGRGAGRLTFKVFEKHPTGDTV